MFHPSAGTITAVGKELSQGQVGQCPCCVISPGSIGVWIWELLGESWCLWKESCWRQCRSSDSPLLQLPCCHPSAWSPSIWLCPFIPRTCISGFHGVSLALVLLLSKPYKCGLQHRVRMEFSPWHKVSTLWLLHKLLGTAPSLQCWVVPSRPFSNLCSSGFEASQKLC